MLRMYNMFFLPFFGLTVGECRGIKNNRNPAILFKEGTPWRFPKVTKVSSVPAGWRGTSIPRMLRSLNLTCPLSACPRTVRSGKQTVLLPSKRRRMCSPPVTRPELRCLTSDSPARTFLSPGLFLFNT